MPFKCSIYAAQLSYMLYIKNNGEKLTKSSIQIIKQEKSLQECSELRRCSPRSQPNTRSRTIPVRWSWVRAGRDVKNVRRKEINLPRFRKTKTHKCMQC